MAFESEAAWLTPETERQERAVATARRLAAQSPSPPRNPPVVPKQLNAEQRFKTPAAVAEFARRKQVQNELDEQGLYNGVVRGHDRAALDAAACKDCIAFFRAEAAGHDDPESIYQLLIKKACRHRFRHEPPPVISGYWDLTFPESETQAPRRDDLPVPVHIE
jgi:hypothetical protein